MDTNSNNSSNDNAYKGIVLSYALLSVAMLLDIFLNTFSFNDGTAKIIAIIIFVLGLICYLHTFMADIKELIATKDTTEHKKEFIDLICLLVFFITMFLNKISGWIQVPVELIAFVVFHIQVSSILSMVKNAPDVSDLSCKILLQAEEYRKLYAGHDNVFEALSFFNKELADHTVNAYRNQEELNRSRRFNADTPMGQIPDDYFKQLEYLKTGLMLEIRNLHTDYIGYLTVSTGNPEAQAKVEELSSKIYEKCDLYINTLSQIPEDYIVDFGYDFSDDLKQIQNYQRQVVERSLD